MLDKCLLTNKKQKTARQSSANAARGFGNLLARQTVENIPEFREIDLKNIDHNYGLSLEQCFCVIFFNS